MQKLYYDCKLILIKYSYLICKVIAEESRTHKLCGDKFSRLSA